MRHIIIAVIIGLITIGISVFVLSDREETYENDSKVDRSITLGESIRVANYDLKPISFQCDNFESAKTDESQQGCVLNVELTNTTKFEQLLVLDGDLAIAEDGTRYESSDDLSRKFIANNGLTSEVGVDETATGGIFFNVPDGIDIKTIEVYESLNAEPIKVEL